MNKKIVAGFFLAIFSLETFYPGTAYALTSGPSQPEMEKFQPAGVNDMVDLFSGDGKYNIPLMDVGGYPLNLSYQSGTGLDDEASWVGTGWTLNPGSVNRNLRGIPDDFRNDGIDKYYTRREFKKVGGEIVIKPSVLAWEFGKPSLKVSVYKDNYYGIGASVGASLDMNSNQSSTSALNAGLNIDVNSDVRDGVDIAPTFSLSKSFDDCADRNTVGLSGSFRYNTREGLKTATLGASYNPNRLVSNAPGNIDMSATHYYGQTYTPTITINTSTFDGKFSFDIGPSVFGGYLGLGGSGYFHKETITDPHSSTKSYGYLYYLNGRGSTDVQLDFNREKDATFFQSSPSIPIPVPTQDLFMATGQAGSRQFRAYYGGNYVVYDKISKATNTDVSVGVTAGFGVLFKAGGRISITSGGTTSKKWTTNPNSNLTASEATFTQPIDEPVYFKQVGECTTGDDVFIQKMGEGDACRIQLGSSGLGQFDRRTPSGSMTTMAAANLKRQPIDDDDNAATASKPNRDKRTDVISYLTATQAKSYGLDRQILNYTSPLTTSTPAINRDDWPRQGHHISEIRVTDKDGKRMVYGIPVYNIKQEEYTFSWADPVLIASAANDESGRQTGLVSYASQENDPEGKPAHQNGRDQLLNREITPAYASSFLLTGVLSPDYVDVTGDGITDDDYGTAYKFKYTRHTDNYRWRTPCASPKSIAFRDYPQANYNEGFLSDRKDDKANIVYGEKEIWYMKAVESRTMIAVFETSARKDALGVADHNGAISLGATLNKLDKIKLYSKAEYLKDPAHAIPIKTVNFEYDYSLYPNVPNNSGTPLTVNGVNINAQKGKLTLKRVYFTFGLNTRGATNPYEFQYDLRNISDVSSLPAIPTTDADYGDKYIYRGSDRWGSYKKSFYNPANGTRGLFNADYPYTLQQNQNTAWDEKELMDRFVSKWQLNKIITPAGANINIEYESDDYAYVQNRQAMQMCAIKGLQRDNVATGLIDAKDLVVELPVAASDDNDFRKKYLKGQDKLFFKAFVDLDNRGHSEYVHGYAEIDVENSKLISSTRGSIRLKIKEDEDNPIARASWQLLRSDLKQYAYDNYDNSEVGDGQAAIRSILQSIGNLAEIMQPFNKKAKARLFANNMNFSRSFVRLLTPEGEKLGGGARVKKISISDEWAVMDTWPGQKTAVYGQEYEYKATDGDGNPISSGVASYEPQVGNEENPFHEPLSFTEKVYWSSDRYHYVEKPFCESWFPAAQVGYSKVKVTDFGVDMERETGYTESVFYTAKDFPTIVEQTTLDQRTYENSMIIQLFTAIAIKRVQTSQGFKVELNDMHGKPKSVSVFNKGGNKISSTEYFYHVKDETAESKELSNTVKILNRDGSTTDKTIGTDMEMATDLRESSTDKLGIGIGPYVGSLWGFITPWPYSAYRVNPSKSANTYRSASMVKIINRYGLIKKVRTMKDGSYSEAENMLWDGETGQVLLTSNQNEFDQHTYAFTYPAWMVNEYKGMGGAYHNIGAVLAGFNSRASDGIIDAPANVGDYLYPGDELGDINPPTSGDPKKGWVVKTDANTYRLIDKNGDFLPVSGNFMVLRSGLRNMLNAGAGTVVLMSNPIAGGSLDLGTNRRVLDAKATEYSEVWGVPVNNKLTEDQIAIPCGIDTYCLQQFLYGLFSYQNPYNVQSGRGLFSDSTHALNAGMFISEDDEGHTFCLSSFYKGKPASQVPYYLVNPHVITTPTPHYALQNGDIAMMSDCKIVFDEVNGAFNTLMNQSLNASGMITYLNSHIKDWQIQINPEITADRHYNRFCLYKTTDCNFEFRQTNTFTGPSNVYIEPCVTTSDATYTTLLKFHLEPGVSYTCQDPVNKVVNPYVAGLLGNWRPKTSNVYATNRVQPSQSAMNGSTDIRNSGYYANYSPFWEFTGGYLVKKPCPPPVEPNPPIPPGQIDPCYRWVTSNTSIYYDQKGNEIESKDAMDRYGAALFGYQQSAAVAIAANARRNEIAYDGFEDYDFDLKGTLENCPMKRHFDWMLSKDNMYGLWMNASGGLSDLMAHTGRHSLSVGSTLNIGRPAGLATPPTSLFTISNGKYQLSSNELGNGFGTISTSPGKEYLLSMWVYDGKPRSSTLNNVTITVNGSTFNNALVVPVVEGWKRVEVKFTGGYFSMQISPVANTGGVFIDDFRIQPLDAKLNTYVYDEHNLRLMAQLDENNYATLYEYDDEGTPIRVKKETERGIVTLKENRKFIRQR